MRKDTEKTRQSLLTAAGEAFARKGYRDATVAEICERAGANIAAVNYHFKDKETLYREAWRYAFRESIAAHPPDGGVSEEALPEERLRGIIVALLRRISDENNKEFLIVHKELANPTGLLEEVSHEEIRPIRERMRTVLRAILGTDVSETQALFCEMSIVGQCITPMMISRIEKERGEIRDNIMTIDGIEAYADHVIRFSLAGIRGSLKKADESS